MFKKVDCTMNEKETKTPKVLGLVILAIIAPILLSSCSGEPENAPEHSKGRPYELIEQSDLSVAGRERREFKIYSPGSSTIDELAHTSMGAALYYQDAIEAAVTYVRLYQTKDAIDADLPGALVDYAPDGRGNSGDQDWTWKVSTLSVQINSLELKVKKSWEANKHKFIESDGLVNEEELTSFIANQLNIPVSAVKLPVLNAKAYEPVFN
jgi:hypothetical protein